MFPTSKRQIPDKSKFGRNSGGDKGSDTSISLIKHDSSIKRGSDSGLSVLNRLESI